MQMSWWQEAAPSIYSCINHPDNSWHLYVCADFERRQNKNHHGRSSVGLADLGVRRYRDVSNEIGQSKPPGLLSRLLGRKNATLHESYRGRGMCRFLALIVGHRLRS